jgi:hypothetical protein
MIFADRNARNALRVSTISVALATIGLAVVGFCIHAALLAGRTRTFTSTRDPRRLRTVISLSAVKRPRSALRNAREIGCGDASAGMSGAYRKALPVERFDDFGGEDGLELLGISVVPIEVPEHIAAATHDFRLFFLFHLSKPHRIHDPGTHLP